MVSRLLVEKGGEIIPINKLMVGGLVFHKHRCFINTSSSLNITSSYILGFKLTEWLASKGYSYGSYLGEDVTSQLLEILGLTEYLLEPQCSKMDPLYQSGSYGWTKSKWNLSRECLTLCLWGNFSFFFVVVCLEFSKLTFSKNYFRNTIGVSSDLDLDHNRHSVCPDLGPYCVQRLSTDD